jgi:replication-associated recombination protein RarA
MLTAGRTACNKRRLVILKPEDVGMADPACRRRRRGAVAFVGARRSSTAHAVTYLATVEA